MLTSRGTRVSQKKKELKNWVRFDVKEREMVEAAALDIFLPVMESAMVIAGHYAKGAGRDVVLAEDVRLGLMFAARNVTGKQIGSLFPEVYADGSDSDGSSSASDDECEWTRYEGSDPVLVQVNECADTWDAWEPETPAERALKNSVDASCTRP
jgi:hypothetical protein